MPRVAHHMRQFGKPSETFLVDAMRAVEASGWCSYAVAQRLAAPPLPDFPRPDRVFVGSPPPLSRRALGRLLRRDSAYRRGTRVVEATRSIDPDIIHAHFGWAGVDALVAARTLDLPLVVSFHATDVTVFPHESRLNRSWYEELFRQTSGVTVVSEYVENALRDLGYTGPTHRIPAGVDLSVFSFRGVPPPQQSVRLLFVGRLVARKGLDVLLDALPLLRSASSVELEVIGDGPLREELQAQAHRLGIADAVRFRGTKDRLAVVDALRRSHVLVMPSRAMPDGEVEGSPVVLKEAMATGVAVVACPSGGTAETLPPALRPELVPFDDPEALAKRIRAVVTDRLGWEQRLGGAREWVEENFDWKSLGRDLAGVYDQAAAA